MLRKMFVYTLNLPMTLLGILFAIISWPIKVELKSNAIIVQVKNLWWDYGYLKNMAAVTFAHVILLGPESTPREMYLEHELAHVEQNMKYPLVFPLLYYWELYKNGYWGNRFEKEAFQKGPIPFLYLE